MRKSSHKLHYHLSAIENNIINIAKTKQLKIAIVTYFLHVKTLTIFSASFTEAITENQQIHSLTISIDFSSMKYFTLEKNKNYVANPIDISDTL